MKTNNKGERYKAAPIVSLTYLLKFLVSNKKQQSKVVSDVRNEEEYSPMRDHWKGVRDGIKSFYNVKHRASCDLDQIVAKAIPKKRPSYQKAVDGYKIVLKSLGTYMYRKLPRVVGVWTHSGITVKVSPELHLASPKGDDELVIKLYLNQARPLTQIAAHKALAVMEEAIGRKDHRRFVVIDVVAGNAYISNQSFPKLLDRVKNDMYAFYRLWVGDDRDAA